jgi:hypothetical protein
MNKERVGFIFQQQGNQQGAPANGMSNGGVVYAAGGTLIPYSPRGTDTVPAMLTPGEFVVNAKATSQNLPLLQSINRSKGGSVAYYADGGLADSVFSSNNTKQSEKIRTDQSSLILARQNFAVTNENKRISQDTQKLAQTTAKQIPVIQNQNASSFEKTNKLNSNIDNSVKVLAKRIDQFGNFMGFAQGGMVYASNGMMIPYEPRGTDTVPAMLTPGEFVVNRAATQANLPLLHAINQSKGGSIKGFADGGVVYAQNGRQMPLPDAQSRKNESYIPFKTLRDKQLAERKSAYEKAQQEKAVRSRLEQGARFYINQDEMERRKREENSPEAAQERLQRSVDRSSRSNIGSGFGSGGIQYDQQGKAYSSGGVVYAQEGRLIPGLNQYLQSNNQPMTEMVPTQGEIDFSSKQAQKQKTNTDKSGAQWNTTRGEISAYGPPAGPGLLAASFYDRATAAWNMLNDIGEAKLAGAKPTKATGVKTIPGMSRSKTSNQSKPKKGVEIADVQNILEELIEAKKNFTVYHGTEFTDLTKENLDLSRSSVGNTLGQGLYTSIAGPGRLRDLSTTYAGDKGNTFAIRVKGSLDDFPEAMASFKDTPKVKTAIQNAFTKITGQKNIPFDIENSNLWSMLPYLHTQLSNRLGIDISDNSFQAMLDERQVGVLLREVLINEGISGIKNTQGTMLAEHPMLSILDPKIIESIDKQAEKPTTKARGGMIYASEGTLVNYQPRGTDTVPAMLTPGEFVVNRASTEKHLPLLRAINSGHYAVGGRVSPAQLASNRRNYLDRKEAEKNQKDADKKDREDNFKAARQQQIEERRARSISGMSVQTRGGSYTQPAMSSSQAQPSQSQQTTQSTISQAIINVAQAVINIANATSSGSSSNSQTGTPSYMTSSTNGPRVQRAQDFFEARRINRSSREQEENERMLYRRRNRSTEDRVAYSDMLASRNTPANANNQNPQAQNSISSNLLQAIQNMFGSAQTATTGGQNQQTGTPRYLTSSINTPGVQNTQDFFEKRRMNQQAQDAERARRAERAITQPANNPVVPGQNAGPAEQPMPNNNIWITLNNNASRFGNALNIATVALGQFNQQLAAGMTQNSVSNNGSSGSSSLNGISQFTQTFQSFIDQLKNINPVINMTGTHTVVVEFGGSAGVFRNMEAGIQDFVSLKINEALGNLSRGTEGTIPTYQV